MKRASLAALILWLIAASASAEISKWQYSDSNDKMRNQKTVFAYVYSLNKVNFDFPYSGGSEAILVLRISPKSGKDVYINITKGQFHCRHDGCTVAIKFDNEPVSEYEAVESASGSSDILFIKPYDAIVAKLKKAKSLIIEAKFFQEGTRQFEFNVSGLKWEVAQTQPLPEVQLTAEGKKINTKHPKWSNEACNLLGEGTIQTGMTKEQVILKSFR